MLFYCQGNRDAKIMINFFSHYVAQMLFFDFVFKVDRSVKPKYTVGRKRCTDKYSAEILVVYILFTGNNLEHEMSPPIESFIDEDKSDEDKSVRLSGED